MAVIFRSLRPPVSYAPYAILCLFLTAVVLNMLPILDDTWYSQRQTNNYVSFLPARRYAGAGLCDSDVSVCLSVCLSVRRTPVLCLAERKEDREMYTVW